MPNAPYSLYVDVGAPISIVKSGTTVTVTTSSPTPVVTGAFVQMDFDPEDALGSACAGVFQATAVSGTVFTYTAAGTTAGTVGSNVTGDGVVSMDFLNPPTNYTGAARLSAPYIELESFQMSASGDGSSDAMGFTVLQDVTPSAGPWFSQIPDDARVRLIKKETGTTPATDLSDVFFHGIVSAVSAEMNESGQGSIVSVDIADVNVILDKTTVAGQGSVTAVLDGVDSLSRSGGTVTITLNAGVRTDWYAGLGITVGNIIGGGGTSWNGSFTIASIGTVANPTYGEPRLVQVKYAQAGSADTSGFVQNIATIARNGRSTN